MELAPQVKSSSIVAASLLRGPGTLAAPAKASGSPAAAVVAPKAKARDFIYCNSPHRELHHSTGRLSTFSAETKMIEVKIFVEENCSPTANQQIRLAKN